MSGQIVGPVGVLPTGGSGIVTFTATARAATQRAINGTTGTFTLNTGTGTVLIFLAGELAGLSTVTLDTGGGAFSMTSAIQNGIGNNANGIRSGIFYLTGQTIHTGSTVVVTNGFIKDLQVASAVLTGNGASPGTAAVQDEQFSAGTISTGPITIPINGVGILVGTNLDTAASNDSGGNLVSPLDFNNNATNIAVVGHDINSGSQTATIGQSAASSYCFCFLPWGP